MRVAVIEGGTISPDMLPFSRHATQAGESDRGWQGIFLEEFIVSAEITISVQPSEEGLGRVQ